MRLSSFNLYVESYPEPGMTLVHNTLSGGFALIDDETLGALRKADAGLSLTDRERELVGDKDLSDSDVGVVVESREVEEAEFQAWFERRRRRISALEALISINLACNFDCPYCCQAGIMSGQVMKPEVADQTGDWLAERALVAGLESVHLAFCGGEPLLHPALIKRIAARVRDKVAPRGLPLTFRLLTNGYFLNDEMVSELLPYGLVGAQVTLDGDEHTHRMTRVSKSGENTFQRIFEHVVAASRRIQVNINGNYAASTAHGFMPLVGKLADAGVPRGTRVGFTPALEGLASIDWNGGGMCTWSDSDTTLHLAMQDEILRRGFDTSGLTEVGPCEFHDHHSFAIDPSGTIFKCPGFLGQSKWGIGHVATGMDQELRPARVRRPAGMPRAHRPNCGGGCVAIKWLKTGEPAGVNCEKPFFDRLNDQAVVRRYPLATSESAEEAVKAFPPLPNATHTIARPRHSAVLRLVAI